MTTDQRPDPDDLLRIVNRLQARENRGILRVFFGMAAGVGKTYAMLKAARQRKAEGLDVVVGIVETHGRTETAALLEGLTVIPRKRIEYRGTQLEELDLDAILARKPAIVLVDELAHTNAPGSRHLKRWQDVLELLDAGMDVYTTMNVQHLESRKETLEQIAGVTIHETVPDSVLEQAAQIDLVDIAPAELLARLREGKVYLGPQADMAQRNFFQEDRLTALREMALRYTAEKVDHELRELRAAKEEPRAWKPVERLLVAISHSPYSEGLIRAAKSRAFELNVPWVALNVNTGTPLNDKDGLQLSRNIALAHNLGAEVVTIAETDIVSAVHRVALEKGVTQIIIGRPTRRWFRDRVTGGTLLERLLREETGLDVHVARREKPREKRRRFSWSVPKAETGLSHYWYTFWIVAGVAVATGVAQPFLGYKATGFPFLLSVMGISLFTSVGPILFASVLSALVWDFFFIPPAGTFHITSVDDIVMCLSFFFAAVVTGALTHRIRRREHLLRGQTERMELLYEFAREVAERGEKKGYLPNIASRLGFILHGTVMFFLPDPKGDLELIGSGDQQFTDEKRIAVARWAFDHRLPAGWSTDTLGGAAALYLPMVASNRAVGVLGFLPGKRGLLLAEEMNLLRSVADQLAVSVERERLIHVEEEAKRLELSEKLHQATLSSVSHELRTPITALIGTTGALKNPEVWKNERLRTQMLDDVSGSAERLNEVVGNLLDMSRIESGRMELRKEWHDLSEIVSFTLRSLGDRLRNHPVTTRFAPDLPLLRADFHLLEQAVRNLLTNAALYTPAGAAIEINAAVHAGRVHLTVGDEGPGIAAEQKARIFEKFYRVPGTPPGGTGLGLSIAKAVVEAHGGVIFVEDRRPKGSTFSIVLPIEKTPPMIEDHGSPDPTH
jgi:two-component system sensor histidine kinase KdpD